MNPQRILLVIAALAILACSAAPVLAAETFSGTIASVGDGQLVLKAEDAQHTFTVGDDATITLDGKEAKLSDLQTGQRAAVIAEKSDDGMAATRIVARSV